MYIIGFFKQYKIVFFLYLLILPHLKLGAGGLYRLSNLYKLLHKEMIVPILKKICQRFPPVEHGFVFTNRFYIHTTFKNHSKCSLGTKIGSHFKVQGQARKT